MTITNAEDNSKLVSLLEKKRDEFTKKADNDDTFIRDSRGQIKKSSISNVSTIFANDPYLKNLFRFNDFTEDIELYKNFEHLHLHKDDIDKADVQVQSYIERVYGVCFDDKTLQAGKLNYIYNERFKQAYNPMKEYLNSVKWDGVKRLDTLFIDYLGAEDNLLNREIAHKWLVGAVGRVFEPGLKFELMPILVGGQGRGKSTLCSALCPVDENGQPNYFIDNLPSLSGDNKDNYQLIHNNWIVEISELDAMRKAKIESTKQFISQTKDQYRKPYARTSKSVLRKNAFIGTTNSSDFLKDRTGNRRFLPVEIDKINRSKDVFHIDREEIKQVIAEAVHYYNKGEKPVLGHEVMDELKSIQDAHMQTDIDADSIIEFSEMQVPINWDDYSMHQKQNYYNRITKQDYLSDNEANKLKATELHPIKRFSAQEVISCVFQSNNFKGKYSSKVSSVMNSLDNFERKQFRVKDATGKARQVRGYVRK